MDRRDRLDRRGLLRYAQYEQVEQARTPGVLPHHAKLARDVAGDLGNCGRTFGVATAEAGLEMHA